MKKLYYFLTLLVSLGLFFTACQKEFDTLNNFGNGHAVVLSSDKTNVAPPASDSGNVVLNLSWTDPEYATDAENYKFIIEIDEQGNNFANPSQTTVLGVFEKAFTGRELNAILAGFGYLYDEPHDMDVRVISSYKNNNERYISAPLTINMTAYLEPSTVIEANTMHVIGDAAQGWDVDVPLAKVADRVFSGVVSLEAGLQFKLRRDAGSWDIDWGIADGQTLAIGTATGLKLKGGNFVVPDDGSGRQDYLVHVDLNASTILVSALPSTMNIIGDAAISWDTDVAMTSLGGGRFTYTLDLLGGKQFKFRQVAGSWDVNWGLADGETMTLGTEFKTARDGGNIAIETDGRYKVEFDFAAGTAKVSDANFPDNLFLVGGGTPADWNPANSLPFRKLGDGNFEIYSPVTENGEFKFLQVQDWAGDWGDSKVTGGTLDQADEQNCKVTDAGFYKINVDFIAGTWTASNTNWGLIGSATPGGWDNDTDMTKESHFVWTITVDLTSGEFKFRANDDWGINYGDHDANSSLERDGANIAVAEAGNYTIRLDFTPSLADYTYTVQKN